METREQGEIVCRWCGEGLGDAEPFAQCLCCDAFFCLACLTDARLYTSLCTDDVIERLGTGEKCITDILGLIGSSGRLT